ncbi:MAG: hypothetical protein JWQ90_2111 [Hydrocarboniphaga sp.]|nr:hypothetical protein [Hydrocarboniphaga sp.]
MMRRRIDSELPIWVLGLMFMAWGLCAMWDLVGTSENVKENKRHNR